MNRLFERRFLSHEIGNGRWLTFFQSAEGNKLVRTKQDPMETIESVDADIWFAFMAHNIHTAPKLSFLS